MLNIKKGEREIKLTNQPKKKSPHFLATSSSSVDGNWGKESVFFKPAESAYLPMPLHRGPAQCTYRHRYVDSVGGKKRMTPEGKVVGLVGGLGRREWG